MSGALMERHGTGVGGDLKVEALVHHCVTTPERAGNIVLRTLRAFGARWARTVARRASAILRGGA